MGGRRWTKEELELMDSLYSEASRGTLMAALPGRTYPAIQLRGSLRGIRRIDRIRGVARGRWFWTHQEDDILKCGWASGLTYSEITELLPDRSKATIQQRRMRLKLPSRRNCWTPEDREAIRRLYPLASWEEVFAALPGRTYPAIIAQAILMRITRLAWDSGRGTGTKKMPWRSEEDAILRSARSEGLRVKDMFELLPGRGYGSIAGHCKALNLPSKASRCWTAEEHEILDRMYPLATWRELLAALPGRTRCAVKNQAIARRIAKLAWENLSGTHRRAGYVEPWERNEFLVRGRA